MKRRHFLSHAAALGALAVAAHGLQARPLVQAALGGTTYRVGQRFRTACGRQLRLESIDEEQVAARTHSYRLRFCGDACAALQEGTHELDGPRGRVALFLQPASGQRMVAWFNHLG